MTNQEWMNKCRITISSALKFRIGTCSKFSNIRTNLILPQLNLKAMCKIVFKHFFNPLGYLWGQSFIVRIIALNPRIILSVLYWIAPQGVPVQAMDRLAGVQRPHGAGHRRALYSWRFQSCLNLHGQNAQDLRRIDFRFANSNDPIWLRHGCLHPHRKAVQKPTVTLWKLRVLVTVLSLE